MDILSQNSPFLRTAIRCIGIRDLELDTDQPQAIITMSYTRADEEHESQFTLEELLASLTGIAVAVPTQAQGDYADINDMP